MDELLTGHTETVLVIDPDSGLFEVSNNTLSSAGYQVLHHQDADEALTVIGNSKLDSLVLDMSMPVANIQSYIDQIIAINPLLPIIIATDTEHDGDTAVALSKGVYNYVMKPLHPDSLTIALHACLEYSRVVRENTSYRKRLEESNQRLQAQLEEAHKDQQAGKLVQQRMLPPTPHQILDYHFSHAVYPANYMSGDYVNYHQVSADKVVFFLVDVTGHGSASAFVTVLINQMALRSRQHFEQQHKVEVKSAAWMLSWINRNLLKAGLERHLTIFLGVLDHQNHRLNYSYGGHFPPAILASGGEAHFLEGRGLPVGLVAQANYDDHSIDLPDDFTLTLMSDGVLEVMPQASLADKEAHLLDLAAQGHRVSDWLTSLEISEPDLDNDDAPPDDISVLTLSSSAD